MYFCIRMSVMEFFKIVRDPISLLQKNNITTAKLTILTYLHDKPRNTYIYPMQECQNVSNTSTHQEVVVLLLNLPCYSHSHVLKTLNARSEKLWFLQLWRYSSGEAIWWKTQCPFWQNVLTNKFACGPHAAQIWAVWAFFP